MTARSKLDKFNLDTEESGTDIDGKISENENENLLEIECMWYQATMSLPIDK